MPKRHPILGIRCYEFFLSVVAVLAVLFAAAKVYFNSFDYTQPFVIESEGVLIEVPSNNVAFGKALRNNLYGRLTKEETETLASAITVVSDAMRYSQYERRAEQYKDQFADADVTFLYKFIAERAITDREGGYHAIDDWEVSPTTIAFTVYNRMINETDDGFWGGDEDYTINLRYYFAADDQGKWAFLKNEFVGFALEN